MIEIKDLQRPGAIDHGRFVQFARNGHEELPQKEHIKGIGKEGRHDERQPCAHPADFRKKVYVGMIVTRRRQEDGGDEDE